MKNVKPMVGQVWENIKSGANDMLAPSHFKNMDIEYFLARHKFIPQTDLEWLALNYLEFSSSTLGYTSAIKIGNNFVWQPYQTYLSHTLVEIKNMRYELGLDEKPIEIEFTARCNRTEEPKMKKIPVSWLKSKGIELAFGDRFNRSDLVLVLSRDKDSVGMDYFHNWDLVSFGDRPNPGRQPVANNIMVDVSLDTAGWHISEFPGLCCWGENTSITEWRPTFDALHDIYEKEIATQSIIAPGGQPGGGGDDGYNSENLPAQADDKPVFTQAMADRDEMPPVNTICVIAPSRPSGNGRSGYFAGDHVGLEVKIESLFTSRTGVELAAWTSATGQLKGGVCSAVAFDAIKTGEEKLRDAIQNAVSPHVHSSELANVLQALWISNKFTIILNKVGE